MIPTEADAYEYLEQLRWPNGPVCPHCGNADKHYFLKAQGEGRRTRTGAVSHRRVWKCASCRKQFSVTTGTVFHGSKVPLRTWLYVSYEMCANKNGIAAREVERKYGVAPKTAWFITHRLREAMKGLAPQALMVGTIVSDETYIGGSLANKHRSQVNKPEQIKPHGEKNSFPNHTPVVSLINADTGEIRSKVVANVDGKTVAKVMAEQVAMESSKLYTDEGRWYSQVGRQFLSHESVNHSAGEYVRDSVSINKAENYFSQFKRSLNGTHHHVSREHLGRYLDEFDFRYSTCAMTDSQRLNRLMGQTGGRRISYKRVRGA